jgi:hypothetical protein
MERNVHKREKDVSWPMAMTVLDAELNSLSTGNKFKGGYGPKNRVLGPNTGILDPST